MGKKMLVAHLKCHPVICLNDLNKFLKKPVKKVGLGVLSET
jgi:hypothetical protein